METLESWTTVNTTPILGPHDDSITATILEHMSFKVVWGTILFVLLFSYSKSVYDAKSSALNRVPGPWYAAFTTLHLKYLFATGNIWKFAEKQHQKYGPVIRLGPRQVWISEKVAMKDILLKTDLPKVSMYAEISRDRNSPGLFGEIRPDPHKKLKRFLGPAFTISSVDQLDYYFKNCVSILIKNYYDQVDRNANAKEAVVIKTDLMRDLHCLALDIMGESAFGKGFGQIDHIFDPSKIVTKRDKQWSKIPDAIFSGLANRYRFVFIKRTFRAMGVSFNFDWPAEMVTAISGLVDERREINEDEQDEHKDVLQHMLDEGNRPDTGVRMNNRDIVDQMSELLLAGSETTSGTIACLFVEIARNPDVKARLLASLPKLGRDDPILDSKTVREDPQYRYLEACIAENLRMHPIASEMGRRTLTDSFNVQDYVLPPFTVVSASYRQLHLNEEFWPEADRFWPERWLEGEERGDAPEPDLDAYFPFSAGKHSCIGQNFAMAEIRTVSANLFSRFDFEDIEKKVLDFRQFITMQMHDGSWTVNMVPRVP